MKTTIDQFLAARAKMQRALGRLMIETIERGGSIDHLVNAHTGAAKGSDMGPVALITLSGAARRRVSAALRAIPPRNSPEPVGANAEKLNKSNT